MNSRFFSFLRQTQRLTIIFFFTGIVLSLAAIFAEVIGLDKNAGGWGRARVGMLVLGFASVVFSAIYHRYSKAFFTTEFWKRVSNSSFGIFTSKYSFTFPIVVLVLILYIWLVSAGTWTKWVSPTRYYASLAQGFEYGTLSVTMKPDPRLAELKNPYDPANWRGKIDVPMDISYYNGKFYIYWGPAPAFLLYLLSPFYNGRIGDLQLTFFFIPGIFLCQYTLLVWIYDRFFSRLSTWSLNLIILLAGTASPLTFMLASFKGARIYEAAISSGQFFLLAGFIATLSSLNKPAFSSIIRLFISGIFLALAFGSRVVMLFPSALIALMVAYWLYKNKQTFSSSLAKLTAMGFPMATGAAAIGWYNWARFGSPAESGMGYALTSGFNINAHRAELISPLFVPQNIFNYLFYSFSISQEFPFIAARYTYTTPIFSFYNLPNLYNGQWSTGLLWTVPFVLFALVPLLKIKDAQPEFRWIVQTLALGFLGAFGFLTTFFWAATRYQADFSPFLFILSAIGYWKICAHPFSCPWMGKALRSLGSWALILSIVSSILLALSVNDARFLFQ